LTTDREPTTSLEPTRGQATWLIVAGHMLPVVWLFESVLFGGSTLYFRDLSSQYAPDYSFLHRSLQSGVWPLWNPFVDGGAPCLFGYPVDLVLVGLGGSRLALAVGPPLHVFLAMFGCSQLAKALGARAVGAWLAGAVYGLAGFSLSCVNLLQLLQGLAWAPWVLLAFRLLVEAPSARRLAALALVAALQLSTLSGEIALQTAVAGLFLVPKAAGPGMWRRLAHLVGAGLLAGLAAAPVLCGLLTLLSGSARAAGFSAESAMAYSAGPLVLAESLLPRLFGDVHAFSDQGFWGQPYYAQGYPYLLSLYVGPVVVLIALRGGRSRLWILVLLGMLLSMGSQGPFGRLLPLLLAPFRFPVKFFFLAVLALSLLAGRGLDHAARGPGPRRRAPWFLAPGLCLLVLTGVVALDSKVVGRVLAGRVPESAAARAADVARTTWPPTWMATGSLCLAAGLLLVRGGRTVGLAGLFAVLDLLTVNATLNPLTDASFYALRPQVRALVDVAVREGTYRWFSYGAANSPGLEWRPEVARRASDVWLYYVDRQALLPRTQALEGLEGIFDVDRTGWAPQGSTLPDRERRPELFPRHRRRLWLANVRWVLSFHSLPPEMASLRGEASFPEVRQPLRLYELADPLPRAFWVPAARVVHDRESMRSWLARPDLDPRSLVLLDADAGHACAPGVAGPTVSYLPIDAGTVRLRLSGPLPDCGYLVVLNSYHPFWTVRSPEGPLPLLRADGRNWAVPLSGRSAEVTLAYTPPWRTSALATSLVAVVIALTLLLRPVGSWLDRVTTNALASVD